VIKKNQIFVPSAPAGGAQETPEATVISEAKEGEMVGARKMRWIRGRLPSLCGMAPQVAERVFHQVSGVALSWSF
jgi:hypothetical protein